MLLAMTDTVSADERLFGEYCKAESARRKVQGGKCKAESARRSDRAEKSATGSSRQKSSTRNSFCSESMAGNLAPIHVEIVISDQNVIRGKKANCSKVNAEMTESSREDSKNVLRDKIQALRDKI
jgi:hypothetical protein